MLRHVWTQRSRAAGKAFALGVAAALWAASPASADGAGPAQENASRPMFLALPAPDSPSRLFPAGSFGHRRAVGTQDNLLTHSNWRDMTIPAGPNGHFYITARVKRQPPSYALVDINFLVDTGASLVALTRADAEALGFEIRYLEFSGVSQTANGEVRFASVTLPELRVGSFKVKDLPAAVVDGNLEISLLGNSFLSRLKSYQVSNDELVMRW